jgi:hypothetical protein
MYVSGNGASSSTKQKLVFLCGRYVCCTEVSTREYPRCHGVQVTMDSVHLLSLHYTCYCCVFTVPLPSNGCSSGSTILYLSKYVKIFCNSHEWSHCIGQFSHRLELWKNCLLIGCVTVWVTYLLYVLQPENSCNTEDPSLLVYKSLY